MHIEIKLGLIPVLGVSPFGYLFLSAKANNLKTSKNTLILYTLVSIQFARKHEEIVAEAVNESHDTPVNLRTTLP